MKTRIGIKSYKSDEERQVDHEMLNLLKQLEEISGIIYHNHI